MFHFWKLGPLLCHTTYQFCVFGIAIFGIKIANDTEKLKYEDEKKNP